MATAQAAAEELVLYERAELRPGLCAALRIQLTGLADVRCRPDLAGTPAERIASASRALAGPQRLAVLLESDARFARMLIVGAAPDRALLAIEPIEARPQPDVDRALALKVRETFELSRTLPVPTPQRSSAALLELGGGAEVAASSRALGLVALGWRGTRARAFVELVSFGRFGSSVQRARVREQEWSLGAGARVGFVLGRCSLGPALDVGVVRASAHGESADGRTGDAASALVRLGLALDLRVAIHRALALRFAPTLELDPLARRFAVEERALALGHVRALLPLTLVLGIDR